MAGAEAVADVAVVLGALVDVVDDRQMGVPVVRPPRGLDALVGKGAGQDAHRVGLAPLGGETRLAGPPAVEGRWMSASVSARPGGQPSTMAPMAGPWLSPKVVTRNRWPKLLCDIEASSRR